jgi:hypothetical protein
MLSNFLAFQLGWLACVLGGANGLPGLGTLIALCIVAWHLWRSSNWRAELRLVVAACLVGAAWESLLTSQGWLLYPSGVLITGTAPHWIVAMWALFATTLNASLRWLQSRWWLAPLLGALAGPLAFYAGSRLGGVSFPDPPQALAVLALGWGVLTPLLVQLARRYDGFRAPVAEAH